MFCDYLVSHKKMEKFKQSLSKQLQNLEESFISQEDARMDDISGFVLSPYEGSSSMEYEQDSLTHKKVKHLHRPDLTSENEVMDGIDAAYFIEDDFDAIDYELRKLFDVDMCLHDINGERIRLKSQLQVVSKKISMLIMEKSPSYSAQLEDMDKIKDELFELTDVVQKIRRALSKAMTQSKITLKILANEKKKHMLRRLHSRLLIIKALYETEYHLRDSIEDGNFPLAIRICIEAKEAANTYSYFSCVSDLMTKLVGTTNLIERELDSALLSLTVRFDQDRYALVYSAYTVLNKVEFASRKLIFYFASTLENSSRTVLEEKYKLLNPGISCQDVSYEGLCEVLCHDQVIPTIRELGFVLCKILTVYHIILRYHTEEDERIQLTNGSSECCYGIMQSHLTNSLYSVYKTALTRFNSLLCCQDFSALKFDQILEIVDMANRLRRFGRMFFGHSSGELAISLEKQAVLYFIRYHHERLDELRMFLENECFTLCPVPNQFTIFDLQDFQFLKESREERDQLSYPVTEGLGEQLDFQLMPLDYANPFGTQESRRSSTYSVYRHEQEPDVTASIREEIVENSDVQIDHVPPNLCNTALNLLRFFGRYIRMTSLLPSISNESVPAVAQLFEFFFCSICRLFGEDGSESVERPERIDIVLRGIASRLLSSHGNTSAQNGCLESFRIPLPGLCCAVQLNYPDELFGIVERVVATESVEFVARQLDLVRPVIESLISHSNEKLLNVLDEFYTQILTCVPETRQLIYDCVASRALKLPVLINSVSNTKWDISELQSQHSSYVDFMLKDFEAFSLRVDKAAECVYISDTLRKLLWDRVIFYAFKALVQGYCEGGRCSTEGRALMQLDFQHLLFKLTHICQILPVPHADYVDGFIKAYYLPESGLEQWISNHSEYTAKQMIYLLGVATHVSKKAKTRIINALND